MVCKKGYIWNSAIRCSKKFKYIGCIIDDSVITCDEIIETAKAVPASFNEKKQPIRKLLLENMISFKTRLDILQKWKVVLYMLIFIIFEKIEVDPYDSLPLGKTLTFHMVMLHMK